MELFIYLKASIKLTYLEGNRSFFQKLLNKLYQTFYLIESFYKIDLSRRQQVIFLEAFKTNDKRFQQSKVQFLIQILNITVLIFSFFDSFYKIDLSRRQQVMFLEAFEYNCIELFIYLIASIKLTYLEGNRSCFQKLLNKTASIFSSI